jgi:iron complex transport system ATP-binding protein
MRGDRTVLHDVSIEIGAGEHVAILGPNGCGKSTLIKTLMRELYPLAREGTTVRLFGREKWHVFDLRALLGIVTNDFPDMAYTFTAREIVLSGFFSSVGIWPHHHVTPEMEKAAAEALKHLEADHLADRGYGELSSGEARRILIARALVHAPKALLLDEPTNSLDLFAQYELRETMRRLAKSGIGIILVTHHLADIIPEIDRVILMKAGRVVADGSKDSLLTADSMQKLFGIRVDVLNRDGYVHAW